MRDIWADYTPPSPKDPKAVLSFGCRPYGADTDNCKSIHPHGPIDPNDGSSIMAVCCHKFGKENHPSLRRDPRIEPKSEAEINKKPSPAKFKPKLKAKTNASVKAKRDLQRALDRLKRVRPEPYPPVVLLAHLTVAIAKQANQVQS